MFICIQKRDGVIHIVSFESHQSSGDTYHTQCDKEIQIKSSKLFAKTIVSIFAADNTVEGLCKNCKRLHDEMYNQDLDYQPSMARGNLLDNLIVDYEINKIVPTEYKYDNYVHRIDSTLTRARGKIRTRLK